MHVTALATAVTSSQRLLQSLLFAFRAVLYVSDLMNVIFLLSFLGILPGFQGGVLAHAGYFFIHAKDLFVLLLLRPSSFFLFALLIPQSSLFLTGFTNALLFLPLLLCDLTADLRILTHLLSAVLHGV